MFPPFRCIAFVFVASALVFLLLFWKERSDDVQYVADSIRARATPTTPTIALNMAWLRMQSANGRVDAEQYATLSRATTHYYRLRDPPQFEVTLSDGSVVPFFTASFSVPAVKIRSSVVPTTQKRRSLATLIPGNASTYTFRTEDAYRAQYAASFFAYTWRKAGYDCLRHLEIMAAGALPVFRRAAALPLATMTHYPRTLFELIELTATRLLGASPNAPRDPPRRELIDAFEALAPHVLAYTRARLTTRAMASYMLRAMNVDVFDRVASVLFLTSARYASVDYGRDMLLHGFIELAQARRVRLVYGPQQVHWLFRELVNASYAYSAGYGHCFTLCRTLSYDNDNENVKFVASERDMRRRIEQRGFDLIVYSDAHRHGRTDSIPFLKDVVLNHDRSRVAFLEAHDNPPPAAKLQSLQRFGSVFLREMFLPPEIAFDRAKDGFG